MTANINEQEVYVDPITRRNHLLQMIFDNTGLVPRITCDDQYKLSNGEVRPMDRLTELVIDYDPDGTFPLLNPETGAQIGTASHNQVMALAFSLYAHMVDTYEVPVVVPPVDPTVADPDEVLDVDLDGNPIDDAPPA